tara:strand:- start:3389 stop:3673 length:285 start_codon:yes stop_codon:yes gene_type:complete
MTKEIDIIKIAREQFPKTIQLDGMDDAIIGLSIRKPNTTNFVYSVNKIIKVLMEDKCTYDEAVEWYEYNIKPLENLDEKSSPMFYDDRPHFSLN